MSGGQEDEVIQPDSLASSPGRKYSFGGREGAQISMPQIKSKLAELFTPNKHKLRSFSDTASDPSTEKRRGKAGALDWGGGYMPRGRAEITEVCRQAFTATCHLLLEATTFPVYLTEQENQDLYKDMFNSTGESDVHRPSHTHIQVLETF